VSTGTIAIAFVVSVCLVIAVSAWVHRANRRAQERRRRAWDAPRDEQH
jgi:putative effector of murein hydrolase LrgA (UPF0299 family)